MTGSPPRLHHQSFDKGRIETGRLGWGQPGGDQNDRTIYALNSILAKSPEPAKQSTLKIKKVVGFFTEDRVVQRLETARQIKNRFGGRVGRVVQIVFDAIEDGLAEGRVAEKAKMEGKDFRRFGSQVNFDTVAILFELGGNVLQGAMNPQAFRFNLLSINGLPFHTFPKVANHHGLTNSETRSHRYGGELKHSEILVA